MDSKKTIRVLTIISLLLHYFLEGVGVLSYSLPSNLKQYFQQSKEIEEDIFRIYDCGSLEGYLSLEEYNMLLTKIGEDFSDLVSVKVIGSSVNKNPISAVLFNKVSSSESRGILFTGMHHANEPVSMNMNIYIILTLLSDYARHPDSVKRYLSTRNLYFIPVINVDGWSDTNLCYFERYSLDLCSFRKNRNPHPPCIDDVSKSSIAPFQSNFGVDLNRNYGFKFAYDEEGSSTNPCYNDYRGVLAFSEPETQAVKGFIEEHSDIKIAFNYHSFDNALNIPLNFKKNGGLGDLKSAYPEAFETYLDIISNLGLSNQTQVGSTIHTQGFTANGEASDWMLDEKKIAAFSYKLGINNKTVDPSESEEFFPLQTVAKKIVKENFHSAYFSMNKVGRYISLAITNIIIKPCPKNKANCQRYELDLLLQSKGFLADQGYFKFFIRNINQTVVSNFETTRRNITYSQNILPEFFEEKVSIGAGKAVVVCNLSFEVEDFKKNEESIFFEIFLTNVAVPNQEPWDSFFNENTLLKFNRDMLENNAVTVTESSYSISRALLIQVLVAFFGVAPLIVFIFSRCFGCEEFDKIDYSQIEEKNQKHNKVESVDNSNTDDSSKRVDTISIR